jgi:pimeloyl-ACP methyl ester carboxylesterase
MIACGAHVKPASPDRRHTRRKNPQEVIYDSADAVQRARRLIPHAEGELIPGCRHDMCFSQSRIVDARVVDFLKKTRDQRAETDRRSVA